MSTEIDYKQIVNVVGDAVIVCGPKGDITLWNPAAERIFGFTESEALGQSLDIIIPENQRGAHWDGFFVTMDTGKTRYATDVLRVPAVNKAGERISIAFTVALTRNEEGITGVVATVRDETERFNEERKLRKQLAMLKAQK